MKKYLIILVGLFVFLQGNLLAVCDNNLTNKLGLELINMAWDRDLSKEQRLDKVKELIDAGANVNMQNNHGNTALIEASVRGHIEIVNELIKAGANINIQNKHGDAALIWASIKGYTEIVKLLIEATADLNIQNNDGDAALMRATANGYADTVNLLKAVIDVEKGINKFNEQGDEIKELLIQRWINSSKFEKLELVKVHWPNFYKLYFDIYKQILSGDISKEEMKKILTGKTELSKLAKTNSGFFAKLKALLTLSKTNSAFKSSYCNLRKDLARVYELNKKGIPKEVTANILGYNNNIGFKYCYLLSRL